MQYLKRKQDHQGVIKLESEEISPSKKSDQGELNLELGEISPDKKFDQGERKKGFELLEEKELKIFNKGNNQLDIIVLDKQVEIKQNTNEKEEKQQNQSIQKQFLKITQVKKNQAKIQEQKPTQRVAANFKSLDGLRGWAATCVLVFHYAIHLDKKKGYVSIYFPRNYFSIFYSGDYYVMVFFVISGFVLTVGFFKQGKSSTITSGLFRRYIRLMIPLLVITTLQYTTASFLPKSFTQDNYYLEHFANSNFFQFFVTQSIGVFFNSHMGHETWTIGIEYLMSLLIYLYIQVATMYKRPQLIFIVLILSVYISEILARYGFIRPNFQNDPLPYFFYLPSFFFGVWISYLQNQKNNILQKLRDLNWKYAIIRDLILAFCVVGGIWSDFAPLFDIQTLAFKALVAALNVIFALTSQVYSKILTSKVFHFMGYCSYAFYLIHQVPLNIVGEIMINFFDGLDTHIIIKTFAPLVICMAVTFFLSYFLTKYVDDPGKDFAFELDLFLRKQQQNSNEQPKQNILQFLKNSKKFIAFSVYMTVVCIITQVYKNI